MTKQEFIDLILKIKSFCVANREDFLITDKDMKNYKALNILNASFEQDVFNPHCFEIIDVLFHDHKIDLNQNIHLIAHLISLGISFYTETEIRKFLDILIKHAKKCPDEVPDSAIATMTSEEYEFQLKEMKKEVQNLKKYVDENGNILPVSPEDSSFLDFKYVFKIEDIQVKAVIKACNKKYFQLQKHSKVKKDLIISQSSYVSKSGDEIIEETKQKTLAYNKIIKFISMDSKNYQVITNDYVTEEDKIEIMRLAKIIGISQDNQKIILQNIKVHNATLLKQKEELLLKDEQEKLVLAMEQTKATYFTETMHFNYNKVLCIVNDVSIINDQSLNYIIAKLKVAKESVDATILGLLKEDLTLDDFKELLELSFEDLNNVLLETKHYNIINQSLERIRKES